MFLGGDFLDFLRLRDLFLNNEILRSSLFYILWFLCGFECLVLLDEAGNVLVHGHLVALMLHFDVAEGHFLGVLADICYPFVCHGRVLEEELGQVVWIQADLLVHLRFWWLHLVEEVDVVLCILFRFQVLLELGLGSRGSPALSSEAPNVGDGVDARQVAQTVELARRHLFSECGLLLWSTSNVDVRHVGEVIVERLL